MDTHLPSTSVREALLFSAKMRQPQSVPIEEKETYVEKVLKMCGLEHFVDMIVGPLGVEHRKRTMIGVELIAKPSLIFLDERTSGLDSQSAWAITSFLRNLAGSGQAIVCTIHQPSAELFQMFDQLLWLCKGGQTVYFGDIGERSPRSSVISSGMARASVAIPRICESGALFAGRCADGMALQCRVYPESDRRGGDGDDDDGLAQDVEGGAGVWTTADFLVAVTDPYGHIARSGFEVHAPRTALEFTEYFKQSDVAQLNREDMDAYMEEFVGKPARARTSSRRV
ncbi:Brefeldin A resistance protein [Grifola frondosa]|uniref:Brefeldin A resistance protein n=1 Tax=Grifola frondosa TaxID=5627 RepID=A0A1C7M3S9_GRIFR|nr:Brefeldin A resistance protein [Grifola frondosa]